MKTSYLFSGVMVSVLWSVVDCGFEPRSRKPKTVKLVFSASLQHKKVRAKTGSLQHKEVRAKTGSLQHKEVRAKTGSLQHKEVRAKTGSLQHKEVRAKTGSLGIRIMCLIGATYLPVDCCFGELRL